MTLTVHIRHADIDSNWYELSTDLMQIADHYTDGQVLAKVVPVWPRADVRITREYTPEEP